MEIIQSSDEVIEIQNPCSSSVDSLAACYLENNLQKGKEIEIPSIGVVIVKSDDNKIICTPEK